MSNKRPYTAIEEHHIGEQLKKNLGPEYIATRSGPAGKLSYIEGQKVISLANEIFGFNGWTSEIKETAIDYLDVQDGRVNCGVTATVRVTLRDGTFHEDVGYGSTENAKTKGSALEKARKQAVTDGVKRALRNFGNALGNCIYEKGYVRMITQMGQPQIKYTPQNLYRHDQFEPAKRTPKPEIDAAQQQQLLLEQKKHEELRQMQTERQQQQQQVASSSRTPQLQSGLSSTSPASTSTGTSMGPPKSTTHAAETADTNTTQQTASHIVLLPEESFSYEGDDEFFYQMLQNTDTGDVEQQYHFDDNSGSEVLDILAGDVVLQKTIKSESTTAAGASSSPVGTRRKLPSLSEAETQEKEVKRSRTTDV